MVRTQVINVTPRDKGTAAESWTPVSKHEGGYSFGNPLIYAGVLEYGSKLGSKPWPSAQKKTAEFRGRIYSTQAVGGFMQKVQMGNIFSKAIREWLKTAFK